MQNDSLTTQTVHCDFQEPVSGRPPLTKQFTRPPATTTSSIIHKELLDTDPFLIIKIEILYYLSERDKEEYKIPFTIRWETTIIL